jgi:low affinity Fe/Cu permease
VEKLFHYFSKKMSEIIGAPWTFTIALMIVLVWVSTGPFFHFSNTWQLIINTGTSIVTFLIVFLIQNTQNRDNESLGLKLDELLRTTKKANRSMIDLDKLSDHQLEELEEHYQRISDSKKNHH